MQDTFQARRALRTRAGQITFFSLEALERAGLARLDRLPYSIRILLEAALRQVNGHEITDDDVRALAAWTPRPKDR
jgi:aconitate hydratase